MVGQRPLHRCFLLINALRDVDHTLQRLVQFLSRGGVKVPTPSRNFDQLQWSVDPINIQKLVRQRPYHETSIKLNELWDVDHTLRFAFHHFLMCLRIMQLS
jgi:hypothetical protein